MKAVPTVIGSIFIAVFIAVSSVGCGRTPTAKLMDDAVREADNGNWNEVFKLAGQVTERDDRDAAAWVLKSLAAEHSGQLAAALESARRGAELCPGSFAVQYTCGRLLAARPGREREALDYLRRAFDLDRADPGNLSLIVQCMAKLNEPNTPSYYAVLAAVAPTDATQPELQSTMGIFYLQHGKQREGLNYLYNAYQLSRDNPRLTLNLARALDYYVTGMQANAPQFYQHFLNLSQHNPEAAGVCTEVEARIRELTRGNR